MTDRLPPEQWQFNDSDRQRHADRYWRCPTRLLHDGTWAHLWREEGTRRGGGAVSSVLPVLALHTWPGKREEGWTYLSRRRIARIAGVNKDTATAAFRRLVDTGLMEVQRRPRARHDGGYKTFYRLAENLYPRGDEPYAALTGNLLYGGTWSMLPSPSCRHLYVVIARLDPISDENAYLTKIQEDHPSGLPIWDYEEGLEEEHAGWWEYAPSERDALARQAFLATVRERQPLSITDLQRHSGLSRSTVIAALQALVTPIFGDRATDQGKIPPIALIAQGRRPGPRKPTWFAPDRRASGWFWNADFLRDPEQVEAARRRHWPQFDAPEAQESRSRQKRRAPRAA